MNGQTVPVWARDGEMPPRPSLDQNLHADVCVIGAGIAGLTAAYFLAKEGRSVVLIDRGQIARGETVRTTAHLSNALDDRYYKLEKLFGQDWSALAQESHGAAIDRIESIGAAEEIDCDFARVDGYLFNPSIGPGDLDLEKSAAHRAGFSGVEFVDRVPLPGVDTGRCLRFPNQAQFHPLHYMRGLAAAAERFGARIYADTPVVKVKGGSAPSVETERGNIVTADAVLVTTNTPIHDNLTIHSKQSAFRSYVIAARIDWDAIPRALYWDTLEPYHYVRLKSGRTPAGSDGHDILIVGGEDHRQGDANDGGSRFKRLEDWTRERFAIEQVECRWSGLVMEPADSLGFIGRDNAERNVFIATGDSGHGMTHGTLAGVILTDLVCGRTNPWAPLYDPSRLTSGAATEYISENLGVAREMLAWVTPGDVDARERIEPGSGAVVRRGLAKWAVYRDEAGEFHERSAVCTHLGCIVSWNSTENSWDCPCHGSQYDELGRVLRGPATKDLTEDH